MSEPKLPSWMNYSDYEDIMHYLRLFGEMKPYYLKAEDVFNAEQEVMKRKIDDGLRLIDVAKEMIWSYKYKERWHQLPKDENMDLTEAKQVLTDNGYLLKENANELTKQEKYALLYLLLKEQGVKLTSNFKDSVIDDQEIDFVINNEYPASIKNGQFGGVSDDLADDPDTIYYAVWFSDDEDDYREETYDINEIIEYVKAGKWNQFVKEELLSW